MSKKFDFAIVEQVMALDPEFETDQSQTHAIA